MSGSERGGVLAVVLGRGGSKGLPGKNVRPLAGHPLIAWSVAAGRAASSVDRVICTTDDTAIAAAARDAGAEIPFMRPAHLATDGATDLDVFSHVLETLAARGETLPELVVQLRPTTPFRDPAWIDAAVAMMRADPSISCVRSVAEAPHTPYKMWRVAGDRLKPLLSLDGVAEPFNMPRQALPEVYWHTGQLDVIRVGTLLARSMTGAEIAPLRVPAETAVDIDTLADFRLAEMRFDELMPAAVRERIAAAGSDIARLSA